MERKYQISSLVNVMNMIVEFKKIQDEDSYPIKISVSVDYFNNYVFFDGPTVPGIDYKELEQEILSSLRPPVIEQPVLDKEMMKRISDAKSGNYGVDKFGVYQ